MVLNDPFKERVAVRQVRWVVGILSDENDLSQPLVLPLMREFLVTEEPLKPF
jgi:hypothetical protein